MNNSREVIAEKMIMYETMNMAPMCAVTRREGGRNKGCGSENDCKRERKRHDQTRKPKRGGKDVCDLFLTLHRRRAIRQLPVEESPQQDS